jgi:hypothetical protein
MYYLLDKKYDETLTINFIGKEEFSNGNKLILEMPECVKGITKLTSYTDTTTGESDIVYLKKFFSYKCGSDSQWSDPLPIEDITTIEICKRKCLQLKLYYYRLDDNGKQNENIKIELSNISIGGEFNFTTSDRQLVLKPEDSTQIFEIGDVLKIFSVDNYEVISTAKYDNAFTIKYRYSYNDKRTWSEWEKLTQPNITTVRWDGLRFVRLQYMFELNPDYVTAVKIYDVILYGDFQNVTANAMKSNLFGLKANCVNVAFKPSSPTDETTKIDQTTLNTKVEDSNTLSLLKETSNYQLHMNFLTNGLTCYGNVVEQLSVANQDKTTLWNPYEFGKITEWHNFLAGTVNDMLGFNINYHRSDPDANGIDRILNEYQLHNIVDMQVIKVIVPENQFPDNQVVINQFNLDLFDTFKINIMKDVFKNAFGVQYRPRQEDILEFCQINRMYIVKHAQVHKDVMNAGIYYDVVLEKYEKRANVINRMEESKARIEELTRNTTIDSLFGFDQAEEMNKVANKIQMKPKTMNFTRHMVNNKTVFVKGDIYNGDIKIMESKFYLENVGENDSAVEYIKQDNILLKSDNRSFITWFNIPNEFSENSAITRRVIEGYDMPSKKQFNLLNNTENTSGYKIWLQDEQLYITINENVYNFKIDIMTNVWMCVLVNLNQRQNELTVKLYRRNTAVEVLLFHPTTYDRLQLNIDTDMADIEYEMSVNGFRAVDNIETMGNSSSFIEMNNFKVNIEPTEFNHSSNIRINGSKMYLSNLRIFSDLITEGDEQTILSQLIIKDENKLIIADNANEKIKAENIPNKYWR